MSGVSLGMVTALTLAAATPQPQRAASEEFRFGARVPRAAAQPLFRPDLAPSPPVASDAGPSPSCRTPVIHGNADVDPKFVMPVPKGEGVPTFTMRWAPSSPCDPSLEQRAEPAPPRRDPRR